MLLEQTTKPQNGTLIGQAHAAGLKECKLAVHRDIVQGLFHGLVRQAKRLLQELNAQHGLHRKRRAPAFGVCAAWRKPHTQFNQAHQLRPWHHQTHLVEEHAFSGSLGDKREYRGRKTDLFHRQMRLLKAQLLAGLCRDSLGLFNGEWTDCPHCNCANLHLRL